jgi:hypothetical protein
MSSSRQAQLTTPMLLTVHVCSGPAGPAVLDREAGTRVSGCGNSPVLAVLDGLHETELVAAGGWVQGRTR